MKSLSLSQKTFSSSQIQPCSCSLSVLLLSVGSESLFLIRNLPFELVTFAVISLGNDLCWHFYASNLSLLALFNLAFSLGASALFNHYKVRERSLKKPQSGIDGASLPLLSLLLFATCCSCLFLPSLHHIIVTVSVLCLPPEQKPPDILWM